MGFEYLTKWKIGKTECGYSSRIGLLLKCSEDDEGGDRIISIAREKGDQVTFREECDGCFYLIMGKDEAKQVLHEALKWLEDEDWTREYDALRASFEE